MNTSGPDALPRAFFLPAEPGHRFCLYHAPQGGALRGCVLFLHPFAEEMNASRQVVAQQCRALAGSGFAVLQIDLLGCGDSSGDFADATWRHWLQDAQQGLDWLQRNTDVQAPLWLWGLRGGALLACECVRQLAQVQPALVINLLLWQPVASGQQQLQQFLRLHAAAQWLGQDAAGEPPAQALAAGRHARVAGYSLSPTLAAEMTAARLDLPAAAPGRVVLLELPANPTDALAPPPAVSPWAVRQQATWLASGWRVSMQAVPVPAFWQNVVASVVPERLDRATREALDSPQPLPATTPST